MTIDNHVRSLKYRSAKVDHSRVVANAIAVVRPENEKIQSNLLQFMYLLNLY
jgi:hypothetical protein